MSQNYQSFSETTVMGTKNILWKFEFDLIIFVDFTGIGSLKYKEIRVSGAKLFLRSIEQQCPSGIRYEYNIEGELIFIYQNKMPLSCQMKPSKKHNNVAML